MSQPQSDNSDNSWHSCPDGAIGGMVKQLNRQDSARKIKRLASVVAIAASLFLVVGLVWLNNGADINDGSGIIPVENPNWNYGGITCQEVQKVGDDYFAGTLDQTVHAKVDLHLTKCKPCESHYSKMKPAQTVSLDTSYAGSRANSSFLQDF